jgi:hypothetical protein
MFKSRIFWRLATGFLTANIRIAVRFEFEAALGMKTSGKG